jgi:hypothetical protein
MVGRGRKRQEEAGRTFHGSGIGLGRQEGIEVRSYKYTIYLVKKSSSFFFLPIFRIYEILTKK